MTEIIVNIEKTCRICLDIESEHISILEDSMILLHIKSCLGLQVSASDNLPKTICISCVTQLKEFYNFQLNARCSLDWLESSMQEKLKKTGETKVQLQPLPDSEYNSDSLLEFLNSTENIEEYLNNLGKDDIPCIVNMLDKNQGYSVDVGSKTVNMQSSKNIQSQKELKEDKMEVDVLDSDIEIVKEILLKETEQPKAVKSNCKSLKKSFECFSCNENILSLEKLSQHLLICDTAYRTCPACKTLFDSRLQMVQHRVKHATTFPMSCLCKTIISNKTNLLSHYKGCHVYPNTISNLYQCKQCHEKFQDHFLLYKHLKTHLNNKICNICCQKFTDDVALASHKKTEHNEDENVLHRCKLCGFSSKSKKEVYFHVQKHLLTKTPLRHLCETCGKSLSSKTNLMNHIKRHHNHSNDLENSDDCKKVICEHCGVQLSYGELTLHCCEIRAF